MSTVQFGAQCPICNAIYEMRVDTEKPLTKEKDGGDAQVMCCPKCKKHPVMFLITHFHAEVKPVQTILWDGVILTV